MITLRNIEIDSLQEILKMSPDECEEHFAVARWGCGYICPYCNDEYAYKLNGNTRRFKCYGCRKQFGVKVGTIFHDSKLNMKQWFLIIYYCNKHPQISSYSVAYILDISQKSAYYAMQLIKNSTCEEIDIGYTFRKYKTLML